MISVEDLLPAHLISHSKDTLSVLCVSTSQPKYLVFGADPTYPIFVVQTGTRESLSNVFDITKRLHRELPHHIPEPLELTSRAGDRSILVQRGLAGQPWFTLRERIGSTAEWVRIKNIAIEALERLHVASAAQTDWNQKVRLSTVIDDIRSRHAISEGESAPRLNRLFNAHRARLDEIGVIELFHQHGDFCVNNLLFRKHDAGIIDFEQFGRVVLPLHDEFLLTGSLLALCPAAIDPHVANGLWHELVKRSRYRDLLVDAKLVNTLFVTYLLWWIVETSASDLRTSRATHYHTALQQMLASPSFAESWNPERTLL